MPGRGAGHPKPVAYGAGLFLLEEARELLLETRQPAAAVEQLLLAAGPGRVRLRVDVEMQRVARFAPGGTGRVLGPIGHDDLDGVVFGVNIGLHGVSAPSARSLRIV